MVPHKVAQNQRRIQRSNYLARARYELRNPGRSHHNPELEAILRDTLWMNKPFNMWDGEGPRDAGYALFGNSFGDEICHPYLGTVECLSLILDCKLAHPDAIHFGFGFNYDVSMILRELSHRSLRMLTYYTGTIWKGWEIEHIPHKWFRVKRGNTACKIYDVRSFFAGNYQSALVDFGIGTSEEIAEIKTGKGNRASFLWSEIEEIRQYYRLELKLGPPLMNALRDIFNDAGYVPRSWHGPGALARMALKRHRVYDAMAQTPPQVSQAAQYGFAAGRFELFKAGHIKQAIHNADINSAYPHFATQLPNLANGEWRRVRNYVPDAFGIYHVRYRARPSNDRAFPLFRRLSNGSVVWPHDVEGWYWNPETALIANDPDADIKEGWVFRENDPTDRPLAWLADYYQKRRELKDAGNAAQFTFKLIINSVYGQFAQRAGWDRRNNLPPRSHQLEYAGYITSGCRASVYTTAQACGDKLVSIDTDGIYSLAPVPGIDIGRNLGQWDISEYREGVFWQSGIYCLATEDGWRKARSRGIKKGSYTAEDLLSALSCNASCGISECTTTDFHIHLSRTMFITYGLADIHGWDKLNTWQSEPHVFEIGGSKRMHFPRACAALCDPPMHVLCQWSPTYDVGADSNPWSYRHPLPWISSDTIKPQNVLDEIEIYNVDHISEDDLWVMHYG